MDAITAVAPFDRRQERDAQYPSMAVPPPWQGIRIAGPQVGHYEIGEDGKPQVQRVPLCGFFRLPMRTILAAKSFRLVMRDLQSTRVLEATVDAGMTAGREQDEAGLQLLSGHVEGALAQADFSLDIHRHLQIPPVDGLYTVHIECAGAPSNSVTIEMRLNGAGDRGA